MLRGGNLRVADGLQLRCQCGPVLSPYDQPNGSARSLRGPKFCKHPIKCFAIDVYLATVNSIDTFIEVSLDCTYLNSLHLKRAVRVPVFQPFKYEIHKGIRSTWTGQPGFGFGPDNCSTLQ